MSDPWWYSGDAELGSPASSRDDASEPGRDWMSLLSGAQRMITWATEQMVAPHAEHDDPREHPQCLLCRGSMLVGDARGFGSKSDDVGPDWERMAAAPAMYSAEPVAWIPFLDDQEA